MNKKVSYLNILIISAFLHFCTMFLMNITTVSVGVIGQDLSLSSLELNFLNLGFFISLTAASLPIGNLISKYGLVKSAKYLIVILIIVLILASLTPFGKFLILMRIMMGFLVVGLPIIAMSIISYSVPDYKLGTYLSIMSAAGYLGTTICPSICGFILSFCSWRYIFLILIPILITVLFLFYRLDNEWVFETDEFDFKGSLMYVFSIICLIYGLSIFTKYSIFLVIIGIFLLLYFFRYEMKIKNPIYNANLFKSNKYLLITIGFIIVFIVTESIGLLLTYDFFYVFGLNVAFIGLILFIRPLIQTIIAPFIGKLSDIIRPTYLIILGMIILFLSLSSFTFLYYLPTGFVIISLILQSVGYAVFSPSANKYMISNLDKEDITDGVSFTYTSKSLGQVFSFLIVNFIIFISLGNVKLEYVNKILLFDTNHLVFAIFALFAFIGIILMYYLNKIENK